MKIPLQITFRGFPHSDAVEANIREKAAKLDNFYPRIMSCRVVVEAKHHHHHKGNLYHVSIDLTVPRKEIAVSHEQHDEHSREDVYVAIRDAFGAAKRQLEDYARIKRGDVKVHEIPDYGRVVKLMPEEDYGVLQTPDGREIYFHRNSVLESGFDVLEVGSEVRYVEQEGDKGPQASTVHIIGKHHLLG